MREKGFTSRRVGESVVILDLESSMYYSVSGSGGLLFDMLRESCSEEDLVAALRNEYEVDEERARADVRAFVEKMVDAGLLVL